MDRERWREDRARKKAECRRVGGREGRKETRNTEEGDTTKEKTHADKGGGERVEMRGRFLSAAEPTDDCEINWLLSAVHCHTIVITSVYVNRRVKSEFNTIINRYVTALKCTPGFKYAFTGECG